MEIEINNDTALMIQYALEDYLSTIPYNVDYTKDQKLKESKLVIHLLKEFEKVEDFNKISKIIIRESKED